MIPILEKAKQSVIDIFRAHTNYMDLGQTRELISRLPEDTEIASISGFTNFNTGNSKKYKPGVVTPQSALGQIAEKSIIHGTALEFKCSKDDVSYRNGREIHRIRVDFHQNNLNANEWNSFKYSTPDNLQKTG